VICATQGWLDRVDSYRHKPRAWNREAERAGKRWPAFCGSLCDIMEDRRDLGAFANVSTA
jgi:hypothetical protein